MPYVRNAWYVAGWSFDLEAGRPLAGSILDEPIVIFRSADRVVALEDRCVHRLAPLSLGRCERGGLRCMYHGLLYDRSGRVVEIPGQEIIPPAARVRSYPAVDRHSWIWVWMGDPSLADEGLIPRAVGFDDPDYILGRGQLDYAAEARLINDNLLDFSHLTYVHAASFQSGPEHARQRPTMTPIARGVRYERWIENNRVRRGPSEGEPLDAYATYDFLIPGVLLMWTGSYPPGTAARLDRGPPDRDQAVAGVTFTSQAVTPMGDRTSRYFFSWGPHRSHGDETLRDALMGIAGMAFAEDKTMIEAQQRVIDRTPSPTVMPTAHDRGLTLYSQIVERLARDEGLRVA